MLWNRTAGLCGRINGMWVDDFENRDGTRSSSLLGFVNSWEANSLTGQLLSNYDRRQSFAVHYTFDSNFFVNKQNNAK